MTADRSDFPTDGTSARLPASCAVAFKEWAGVCDALAAGRQALIVRKGGIAEGPRGFVPEHSVFWLYPTHVHQAEQGLRGSSETQAVATEPAGMVGLRALVVVGSIAFVAQEQALAALHGLHVWTEATILKRFQYRKPGLWVLGVRVFRRDEPHLLAVTAEHAGCKTWVPLDPALGTAGCVPVFDDAEFRRQGERLQAALG